VASTNNVAEKRPNGISSGERPSPSSTGLKKGEIPRGRGAAVGGPQEFPLESEEGESP